LCVARACVAILCGRITTEGRREFYFDGETKDDFRKAAGQALTGFDGYKFDVGEQEDSLWEPYLNVLYPSPEDLQRIANMALLSVLAEKDDVLTAAQLARDEARNVCVRTRISERTGLAEDC